jgi:hypothetical protein
MNEQQGPNSISAAPQQDCPSCGYCPHCGRSNVSPWAPAPYPYWVWPQQPWPCPPYIVTYSSATVQTPVANTMGYLPTS